PPSLIQHRSQRNHHLPTDPPPAFVFTTSFMPVVRRLRGSGLNTTPKRLIRLDRLRPQVVTSAEALESPLPPAIQEALGELVGAAREGLLALVVGVGLGVRRPSRTAGRLCVDSLGVSS